MTYPPHDYDDPSGYLNAIEAALLQGNLPPCPHCEVRRELIPMSGNGWGVETIHESACPTNAESG